MGHHSSSLLLYTRHCYLKVLVIQSLFFILRENIFEDSQLFCPLLTGSIPIFID
ncbi:hypothetical protein CK203_004398 [Vitis vinifera]|uniref:Uncharacterized protein n=1 Tax=Vitis vinifera TaxID=29760 RepID=A0A438K9I5_VITVI|nr:hypothetical protein CK203_004398 [Vitis vinifera]